MYLLKEIKQILGGDVSTKNSKMPGTSFGLSTAHCDTGGHLRTLKGSVCASCYAERLEAFRPSVKKGWLSRTEAVHRATETPGGMQEWVDAFVQRLKMIGSAHHRWHDSGDLQSNRHLSMIISVAQMCPEVSFWLPTKEKAIVKRALKALGEFPPNLTVRVSMPMVDMIRLHDDYCTSAVITPEMRTGFWVCPARGQENSCQDCRACWDSTVRVVCYPKH